MAIEYQAQYSTDGGSTWTDFQTWVADLSESLDFDALGGSVQLRVRARDSDNPSDVSDLGTVVTVSVEVQGTLSGALPALTGSFAADSEVPASEGTFSGDLPALVGSFVAESEVPQSEGVLSGTLPALTGSFTGASTVPASAGTFTGELPALTGSFVADFSIPAPTLTLPFTLTMTDPARTLSITDPARTLEVT